MADAKISLTLTPAEFDTLREELDARIEDLTKIASDAENKDFKAKDTARRKAAQIVDLLRKLK